MASQDKPFIKASHCANRAGRFAFGLDDAKAASVLRQLADDYGLTEKLDFEEPE